MKNGNQTQARIEEHELDGAAIEIDVDHRSDALRLMAILAPFHSFLVQQDETQWVVHARVPGCAGESLEELVEAAETWALGANVPDLAWIRSDGATGSPATASRVIAAVRSQAE